MRALLGVVFVVAFAGCDFGVQRCSVDADCRGGGVCSAAGLCLQADGGATTGGGGGTTGGGTGGGGGMTGGGTGGGSTGGGGGADLCAGLTCPTGFACEAGACALKVTGVAWVQPTAGLTNDAGSLLVARLTTTAAVTLPATLSYSELDGGGGVLSLDGGDYTAATALSEGEHQLTVRADFADAGFSSVVDVTVDLTGPTLTGALPASAKRDDLVDVVLDGPMDTVAGSVVVTLNQVAVNAAPGACPARGGCWRLDFSAPVMDRLTDTFTVRATATDTAGNTKQTTVGTVSVSRIRWETTVTSDSIRAAPAIGVDGTIFVGSTNTNTNGNLYAIGVDGGAVATPVSLGAMQSVATARSNDAGVVFFTANDASGGSVGARLAVDLTRPASLAQSATGNALTPTYSAVGLVAKSASEVGAIATFNSIVAGAVNSRVVIYGTSSASEALGTTGGTFDSAPVPNPLDVANNIIVNGTSAYLLTRPAGAGLHRQVINTVNATPTLGSETTLASSGSAALASGQALAGTESVLGGQGALQLLYRVGTAINSGNLTIDADNGLPAIASASLGFVGRGNDLVSFNPSQLGNGATSLAPPGGAGVVRTSPVLGKLRPGQTVALGYAVNAAGRLLVFPQSGGGATDWGSPFTAGSPTVYAHPTLDCNRRVGAATTTTGVLYLASTTSLVSVIVDSPKLDDTAMWPKYQRTAANAGNPDAARFPLNSGCP